ncbi:MAG: hypothetical protein AAF578_05960 [Pseudomonadota bacterium]
MFRSLAVLALTVPLSGCWFWFGEDDSSSNYNFTEFDTGFDSGSDNSASGTTLYFETGAVMVRDDSETLLLNKSFTASAGTVLDEVTSGIDIDVSLPSSGSCNGGLAACEVWSITARNAESGYWTVGAIGPGDTESQTEAGVYAVPQASDSLRVTNFSGQSFGTTSDGFVLLTEDGRLMVQGYGPLHNRYQPDRTYVNAIQPEYTPHFLQTVDRAPLTNIVEVAAISADYGLALAGDGTVYEWWDGHAEGGRTPRRFTALMDLAAAQGATVTSILVPQDRYEGGVGVGVRQDGGTGAALLSNGRVAVWSYVSASGIPGFSSSVSILAGIDSVTDISMQGDYVSFLRADGSVWEMGELGQSSASSSNALTTPTAIPEINNAVAVSGRKALLSNGQVLAWQPTDTNAGSSTPFLVPGITDAVEFPDSRQYMARRTNGEYVAWAWSFGSDQPLSAIKVDFGAIGEPAHIAGNFVIDAACNRLWRTDMAFSVFDGGQLVVTGEPVAHVGGVGTCASQTAGHVVHIYVVGPGRVESMDERLTCERTPRFIGYRHCTWTGAQTEAPTFIAVPENNAQFRDWRWDCQGTDLSSGMLYPQLGDEEETQQPNSETVCKATFEGAEIL